MIKGEKKKPSFGKPKGYNIGRKKVLFLLLLKAHRIIKARTGFWLYKSSIYKAFFAVKIEDFKSSQNKKLKTN